MIKKASAFTLIEILVVVSIMGLLIAILVPSLSAAKRQARKSLCASNLHQVGAAMVTYLQTSGDRMPKLSIMPSISPAPCDMSKPPVYMSDLLFPQIKGKKLDAMRCPEDIPGLHPDWYTKPERDLPNTGKSYWETERSSYGYNWRLGGLMPPDFSRVVSGHWHNRDGTHDRKVSPDTVWFASDYDNFHGKGKKFDPTDPDPETTDYGKQVRNYVYIDGHVSNFEN